MTDQENNDERERKELMEFLKLATAKLAEHFSSVRIVATTELSGHTQLFTTGSGNIYAQHGSVAEWLEMQQEQTRMEARDDWEGEG